MKYIWNIRNDLICSAILIKHFTRYSTACSCAPYCEVELLRPVAHIWSRKPCIWSCTWRVLDFHSCEYSSEFYFKVLGWGNTNLNLLIQAADVIHLRWNCWHFLLLFDSEWVHGKTSNSKCLLHVIFQISSVWSWDARLNSIWSTEVNFTCCLSFIIERRLGTELAQVCIWVSCFEITPGYCLSLIFSFITYVWS